MGLGVKEKCGPVLAWDSPGILSIQMCSASPAFFFRSRSSAGNKQLSKFDVRQRCVIRSR